MPALPRYLLQLLLVSAIYFFLARLGLSFAVVNPNVSPIWPPSGFALAILIFQLSLWPAIALGAFMANLLLTGAGALPALGIAVGNCLEAVVGAVLLTRFANPRRILLTVVDTSKFVLYGPVLSSLVSATIGNLSLLAAGIEQPAQFPYLLFTWWVGDAVGALVFAPFFWAMLNHREMKEPWSGPIEKAALLGATALIGGFVFLGWFHGLLPLSFPGTYLVVPFLILGALRVGPVVRTAQSLIISLMAAVGAAFATGVFQGVAPEISAVDVQTYLGILTVTVLFLSAGVSETRIANTALEKEVEARRRSEARLQESNQRFTQLADNVREVFFIQDVGRADLVYISPAYETVFGRSCQELYADPLSYLQAVHPEDRGRMEEDQRRQLRGHLQSLEFRIVKPNGQVRWIFKRAYPVSNEQNQLQRVVGIAEDITDRKESEVKLRSHASQLLRSNSELEYFASTASHDLKAPLRMISNYVQLLSLRYKGRLDADADDYIRFAVDGVKRMSFLIDDLLEYSRAGLTPSALDRAPLDPIVDRVIADLKPFVEESQALVTRTELPEVFGNGPQLGLVFQNLIANALKYTRKGVQPVVQVSCAEGDDEWVLSVADNGVGIAPRDQKKIFKIFQRLHTEKGVAGSGIGLATCQRIVERLGGRIWVESAVGEGSTFYFTIPRRRVSLSETSRTSNQFGA